MPRKAKRSNLRWYRIEGGTAVIQAAKKKSWVAATKGANYDRTAKEKVASVQRSFERARRGKGIFGLEKYAE